MTTLTHTIAGGLLLGALAACTQTPPMQALQDPNYFIFRQENGLIAGNYNPAGYSQAEVRELIGIACKGDETAEFTTASDPNGLELFAASCPQGPAYDKGIYEGQKAGDAVRIEGLVPMDGATARIITEN